MDQSHTTNVISYDEFRIRRFVRDLLREPVRDLARTDALYDADWLKLAAYCGVHIGRSAAIPGNNPSAPHISNGGRHGRHNH